MSKFKKSKVALKPFSKSFTIKVTHWAFLYASAHLSTWELVIYFLGFIFSSSTQNVKQKLINSQLFMIIIFKKQIFKAKKVKTNNNLLK